MNNPITSIAGIIYLVLKMLGIAFPDYGAVLDAAEGATVAGGLVAAQDQGSRRPAGK